MRLIDADALLVALRFAESHMIHGESEWLKGYVEGLRAAIAAVKDCATIEAEPVKRDAERYGRWVMRGGWLRCSECDERTLCKRIGGTGGFSYELEQVRSKYCPNCGAKMLDNS